MTLRQLLPALMMTSLLLAGCAGDGGRREADGDEQAVEDLGLKATSTTGIIRGIVVDDAVRPLGAASLAVGLPSGGNRTTESAEDGAFGFDGLEPGTYFLQASKDGYVASQTSVDVVAGDDEPPIVKVLLALDPATLPYVSTFQYDAFIGCSVTTPSVSAAVCDMHDAVKEATNNEFLVSYDADKPPQWIQSEAIWQSTQPLGSELSLSITDFSQGAQVGVNDTRGPSPIHITVNATDAALHNYGVNNSIVVRLFSTAITGTDVVPERTVHDAYAANVYPSINNTPVQDAGATWEDTMIFGNNPFSNEECIEYPILFNSCYGVGGAGVVVNQQVTVYTHVFYGFQPPSDWRFSEAGTAPTPPSR